VSSDKLDIGFDVNNNNQTKIFYDVGFGFTNTVYQGSLMMRPVFDECETDFVSVKEQAKEVNAVTLYPNPANDVVNIQANDLVEQVSVMDVSGKTVMNLNKVNSFSVRDISKGIYLVRVKTKAGIATQRLVIE
jgi:hypothetical protein